MPSPLLSVPTHKQTGAEERKTMNANIDGRLLKNAVLFRLKNSCKWGNNAKVPLNEKAVMELIGPAPMSMTAEEAEERLHKAMQRLRGKQKLVVSPEYDAIKEFQSETKKRILRTYCNPSFIDDGLYTVKLEALPDVIAELKAARERLSLFLVTAFKDALPEQIEAARPVLGELFNQGAYPKEENVPGLFDITWSVVQLDIPEGLPPEIREEEERKLRETYQKAEQAIMGALWSEFQKFLDHIVERLTPGEDGKKKKFNSDILGNLAEFVGAFNNRNTFNDERLGALVTKANEIISNATGGKELKEAGEALRSDEVLRAGVVAALAGVKTEVEQAITDMPMRAFALEEEEAV